MHDEEPTRCARAALLIGDGIGDRRVDLPCEKRE